MTPQELNRLHAVPLAGRVRHLNLMQKLQLAETAHDYGFIDTANILLLDTEELTACMVECNYAQCPSCEEWREAGELEAIEDVDGQIEGPPVCEECRG